MNITDRDADWWNRLARYTNRKSKFELTGDEITQLKEMLSKPKPSTTDIAELLKSFRLNNLLSQGDMARLLGVSVSHYSAIENGTAQKAQEPI